MPSYTSFSVVRCLSFSVASREFGNCNDNSVPFPVVKNDFLPAVCTSAGGYFFYKTLALAAISTVDSARLTCVRLHSGSRSIALLRSYTRTTFALATARPAGAAAAFHPFCVRSIVWRTCFTFCILPDPSSVRSRPDASPKLQR